MGILTQTHNGLNFLGTEAYIQADGSTKMTIKSDGKVGIGTTSPGNLLHLESASSPALQIKDTTNNVTFKAYSQDSNAHLGTTSNHDLFIDTNSTSRITVKSSGNVGIGTTSPSGKLMVQDDTAGSATKMIVSNGGTVQSGTAARLSFYEGATEKSYIERRRDGTGKTAFVTPADDNPFVFENATGEFLRMTNSNVGIGTTSPSELLELDRDGKIGFGANGDYGIRTGYFDDTGGVHGFHIDTKHGGTWSTRRLVVRADSGNVGIGTTSPASPLHVIGSRIRLDVDTGGFYKYNADGSTFRAAFYDDGSVTSIYADGNGSTPYMTFNNSNVGIGTTNPGAKLEVASTGSNGSSGLSDYGFVVTTSNGTDQPTLGAESTGDGYANLNLGSNISGTRRFWHISKRKAADSHKLSFYYYNGTGFSEPFHFETNGVLNVNGADITSTKINNWDTAYGWGNHASANYLTSVDWTDIDGATRTNYTLKFKPPDNSYAGFQFLGTDNQNAGYFLIRGTSDNDVYTAEGVTLVVDQGWLTLAQRTQTDKGIRFMTGSTATTRMTIANGGDISMTGALSVTGKLTVSTVDATSTAVTALLLGAGNEVKKRGLGSNAFNSTTIPTNNNQLTNGAGYITGLGWSDLSGDQSEIPVSGFNNDAGYITGVTNISGYSGTLLREDNRTISPSELTAGRMKFGFTSWGNNNTSPYADFMHLRSYTDSSGGKDNLVMFKKNGIGMRIWQQDWGSSTAYSSYEDVWTTGDFTSTNVSNWNTAYSWGDHASAGYLTAHPNITAASSSDNSGRTYIQDITLDSNGHVTGITTATETVTDTNTTYSAGSGLDLSGTSFSVEADLRDGITHVGKDANNYITFDSTNGRIDFYAGGVFVARMESDGDLHVKGDVIAFSNIFA